MARQDMGWTPGATQATEPQADTPTQPRSDGGFSIVPSLRRYMTFGMGTSLSCLHSHFEKIKWNDMWCANRSPDWSRQKVLRFDDSAKPSVENPRMTAKSRTHARFTQFTHNTPARRSHPEGLERSKVQRTARRQCSVVP